VRDPLRSGPKRVPHLFRFPSVGLLAWKVGGDSVTFDGSVPNGRANFQLGAGSDSFELGVNTNLSFLYIDFGPGTDTFTNNSGATQPRLLLQNLPQEMHWLIARFVS
jgi:hypothetical protein